MDEAAEGTGRFMTGKKMFSPQIMSRVLSSVYLSYASLAPMTIPGI